MLIIGNTKVYSVVQNGYNRTAIRCLALHSWRMLNVVECDVGSKLAPSNDGSSEKLKRCEWPVSIRRFEITLKTRRGEQ